MKVPAMLRESAATYEQRNAVYGDAYKRQGDVMAALFPFGIMLQTPRDFARFTILATITSKILRYSNEFGAGGHDDSLLDISTYAAMLREIDAELLEEVKAALSAFGISGEPQCPDA